MILKLMILLNLLMYPGGFLILQINDIKNSKIEIDLKKNLKN